MLKILTSASQQVIWQKWAADGFKCHVHKLSVDGYEQGDNPYAASVQLPSVNRTADMWPDPFSWGTPPILGYLLPAFSDPILSSASQKNLFASMKHIIENGRV